MRYRQNSEVKRHLLLAFALAWALCCPRYLSAGPDAALTTIELQHLSAEQLIPSLRPLLGAGETISGHDNLLILRVAPALAEQIRSVVAGLDQPAARLLVSVRYGGDRLGDERWDRTVSTGRQSGVGPANPGVGSEGSRRYQTAERAETQQLEMLAGHTAYLMYSRSEPYPTALALPGAGGDFALLGLDYQELQSGFTVTPLLQGAQLILEITVQNAQPARQGGGILEDSAVRTTVRGVLGEWIRLGGAAAALPAATANTRLSTAPKAHVEDREMWVRFDRLD